jgi:hypothetical protein
VDGEELLIPIDLIVPEGAATGGGRRGARLGLHGNRAARRAVGLEAALVDHAPKGIPAQHLDEFASAYSPQTKRCRLRKSKARSGRVYRLGMTWADGENEPRHRLARLECCEQLPQVGSPVRIIDQDRRLVACFDLGEILQVERHVCVNEEPLRCGSTGAGELVGESSLANATVASRITALPSTLNSRSSSSSSSRRPSPSSASSLPSASLRRYEPDQVRRM